MHERQPETPIHQVNMRLDPTAGASLSSRQRAVQPPLPPPPNPQYLADVTDPVLPPSPIADPDPAAIADAEIAAAEVMPDETPSAPLYEVHTEGPLTYFDYYFEEMGTIAPDRADESPARSKLTVGLMGAGVVAATVVSGLVIGDIWQKSQAPEAGKPKDASLKQNAAKNPARPTTVAPEQQNLERSQPSVQPQGAPTNRPTLSPRKTSSRSAEPLLLAPSLPPVPAIAAPETLALATPRPSRSTAPASPPAAKLAPAPWVARTIPRVSVAEVAQRQAALTSVARPENLPLGNVANRSPVTPSTPLPPDGTGTNTDPLPPPGVDPLSAAQSTTGMTREIPGAIAPPPPSSTAPETAPNPNSPAPVSPGLQRLFPDQTGAGESPDRATSNVPGPTPGEPNQANLTAPVAPVAPAPISPAAAGDTQNLQDYLNLPKTTPQKAAIALMPLSQQAAVEAGNTTQVGSFAVRQVSAQEYQQEWLASNKTSEDPAIALAFPAYGFIDYQRQVIVVLQAQPDKPLQSQQSTLPNS